MAALPLIVFDVNETLLDLGTMEPTFERISGEKGAMRLWFANLIMYSAALTVAGCYVPFTDIGSAVMKMLADTRGIRIDDRDRKELTEKFSTMPPHPEVPAALRKLRRFSALHPHGQSAGSSNSPARAWRHRRFVRTKVQCGWRQAPQAVARGLRLCRKRAWR
jgi:hypothetical protein